MYSLMEKKSAHKAQAKSVVKKEKSIGVIQDIVDGIKVKSASALDWKAASNGHRLFSGDEVASQKQSRGRLILNNKAFIELEAYTQLKVEAKKELNLDLQKGFIFIDFTKENKNLVLKLGKNITELSSQSAKMQVMYEGFGDPFIFVMSGVVSVGSDKQKSIYKAGDRIIFKENKPEKISNNIEIEKPTFDEKNIISFSSPFIFAWNSKYSRNSAYNLEISEDIRFKEIETVSNLNQRRTKYFKLGIGTYYWRVWLSDNGTKVYSPISRFEVTEVEKPVITEKNLKFDLKNADQRIASLNWQGANGWSYDIEIHNKNTGKIEKLNSTVNVLLYSGLLPNSSYEWRVRSHIPLSDWSEFAKIDTQYLGFLDGLMPNGNYMDPNILAGGIPYSWNAESMDKVDLIFSYDSDFKTVLRQKKDILGNKTLFDFQRSDLKKDTIYWKVVSKDFEGFESAVAQIFIRKSIAHQLTPDNRSIEVKEVEDKVAFNWVLREETKSDNLYFEVSESDDFVDSIRIALDDSTRNALQYHFTKSAKYFWKIGYQGPNPLVKDSNISSVYVEVPNPLDSPKIYKHYDLKYGLKNGAEVYPIKWGESKDAITYLFEVYRDESLNELVLSETTPTNYYLWKGRTSGQYYYRVKAIGEQGRISRFSSLGKLIFPIAPLAQ